MKRIIILFILNISLSCAHSIHLVHTTSFDSTLSKKKPKIIKSQSEQFVFLGFSYDTDYVDQAYHSLQKKCQEGRIEGITTQFSTSLGFLSWKNKILMQGLCYH